ncbi:hypothetical protein KSF_074820 [Reticulibacter mediterranei]|uniref:Peptidoglycan binding-like domain-containing protein n=1 Tax=Reticulibacter mediterranei TaxID=2778369 RepID=A0A8J3N3S6_9CHLR|nr:neuraminidase-like domain-containing protein [Reticulibacter mediterranei]GHO97434.1 hypothetical protein KSF_074820 [Reticulibacter mediterranei]
MNLQGRDLKLDLSGDDVRLLHSELVPLGLPIPDDEQQRAFFGKGTHEAVARFQKEHRIEPTGIVDAETARAINKAVDDILPKERVVRGQVTQSDGQPFNTGIVRAFDQNIDTSKLTLLGEVQLDAQGQYYITYKLEQLQQPGKQATNLVVLVYDGSNTMLVRGNPIVNATADAVIDLIVPDPFVVRGLVRQIDGTPLVGALVCAFDRDMRSEELLGEVSADQFGHYEITYTAEQFSRAEKGSANLVVRVYDLEGHELAASDIIFNAKEEVTVNLDVKPLDENLSEYERLTAQLIPVLMDIPLYELTDPDIEFLAGYTGNDRQQIDLLRQAANLARGTQLPLDRASDSPRIKPRVQVSKGQASGIPAEVFYGWFRDGQPQVFNEIIHRSTDDLMVSLDRAIARTDIPPLDQSNRDQLRHTLGELRVDDALQPTRDGEAASLGDVLRMIPQADRLELDEPDGRGRRIAAMVVTATPENGLPWQEIRKVLDDDDLFNSVQRMLRLMTLTRGYMPLMQAIPQVGDSSLSDLVTYDAKDWIEFARQYGVPAEIEAATEEERAIQYGQQIARTVELMHPTPFIQHRIASDRIPITPELKEPINAFLSANPALRYKEQPILAFLASDNINWGELSDETIKAITLELLKIERIARLTPSLEYIGPLLSSGYESARDVLRLQSREVFIQDIRPMIEDEAESGRIYDLAAGIVATTEALVLMHSPRFGGRNLPVIPAPNGQMSTFSLGVGGGAGGSSLILPANLQQLFGNQDYCECEHGASLYGAAAYLADLLQMLDRGPKINNKTALQVLLQRRPDLAELDLSGDNTDITLPYIDLVLEILEAPDWESGLGYRVIRGGTPQNPNPDFDNNLNQGEVPNTLADDLASWGLPLSENRTAMRAADVQNSGGASFNSWLIRDLQSGMKLRLIGVVYGAYRIRAYPQSVSGVLKSYRPWSKLLSSTANNVSKAHFPWKLPFDVVRDEANTWLDHLGATREEIMLAFAGSAQWTDIDAACEALNISPAERDILVLPASASKPDYQDWGFANSSVGAEGVFDPIAGAQGTFDPALGQIHWQGAGIDRFDPPDWYMLLKNVSLLRSRARLTHRELLNVLETRFVRADGPRLEITDDECDTALMRLEAMDAALVRRIHLFVRLWRRLGWTTTELDQAIKTNPTYTTGNNNTVAFTESFLLFVANIARLRDMTAVPVANLIDLFGVPTLDTTLYWEHSGSRPTRALSRYQFWFDNPTLGKPRLAEFRINAAGSGLERVTSPANGLPKIRISDHLTYVAAALALPESEFASLLPAGTVCIQPMQLNGTSMTGVPVDVGRVSLKEVEIVIGVLSVGATFSLLIQHSDDGITFTDVPAQDMSVPNPFVINSATPLLSRFSYSGVKPYLRATIASTAGANPTLWVTVRVLTAPGMVNDELSLANLTTLYKYSVLRRIIRRPIAELQMLMTLSGINPLAAANPHTVLMLLEAQETLDTLGLSISEANQLLRGPGESASENLEQRAEALLTTTRSESRSIRDETTVTADQRSALLIKVLTGLGWDERLIASVLGAEVLDVSWGDYEAPLDMMPPLPAGVTLPSPVTYDAASKRLIAPHSTRPTALHDALALILPAVSGNLQAALAALDSEAVRREASLKSAQALLRAKSLPIHRASLAITLNQAFEVPSEWRGRFYYERATNELCFVGWMMQADVAGLKALGASLPAIANVSGAVDALYTSSNTYVPFAENSLSVRENAAYGIAIEEVLLDTIGLQERSGLLLEILLPKWRSQKLHAQLSAALVQDLGCPIETAQALLDLAAMPAVPGVETPDFESLLTSTLLLASDPATRASRAAFPQAFDAAAQLLILGNFVEKLGMSASQVAWLRDSWSGLDLTQLPTTRITSIPPGLWASLTALASLFALVKNAEMGVSGLLKTLAAAQRAVIDYPQLAAALNCSESTLRILASSDGLNITASAWFRDPTQLLKLVTCLELSRKTSLPATLFVKVKRMQIATRPATEAETEVQTLRQIALGGSTEGSWSEDEDKVLDQIRQRRRDATVDYLVHVRQVRDANDLYGYYLIDPQMGPCMMTSRIVQAISSVQLFIQRCLMQLELDAPPNAINKQYWAWMKNYRVWEANRKVLLYPENWIEPELRDDKTPFFEDLVSSLQQGDATSDKAQLAMQTFLEKLTDFSKMEFVATSSSYDDDNRLLVTHIFARTLSQPHTYWYRQFRNLDPQNRSNSTGLWTSWQAVSLDIEGNHLFSIVWQGRLFLFWAIFSAESDEPSAAELKQDAADPTPPRKFWRFKLAWSEYKSGAWTSRRLAQDDMLNVRVDAAMPTESRRTAANTTDFFFFWLSVQEGGVTITGLYNNNYYNEYQPFTTLLFDGQRVVRASGTYAYVSSTYTYRFEQTPSQTTETPVDGRAPEKVDFHYRMSTGSSNGNSISLNTGTTNSLLVLKKIPRNVEVMYSAEIPSHPFSAPPLTPTLPITESARAAPFFVSDRLYRFFVYPIRQLRLSSAEEVPCLHFYALDWPQATRLRKTLVRYGVERLLSFESQSRTVHPPSEYFNEYQAVPTVVLANPDGDLEYSLYSASSTYNYELFFHVPFAIACSLSKNQRFEEARQWFHYIFDPTDDSTDESPARYWRFRPFRELPGLRLDELVQRLADPKDQSREKLEFQSIIAQWKDQPFKPHLVARMRLRSYMYAVVMKYLDNIIAWADQLFRHDTMESLNEATQLYILAAQILGRRPEGIPPRTRPVLKSFTELAASQPDDLTNALVEAENLIPNASSGSGSPAPGNLQSLYFCVPNNPKLDEYYDQVEDKLFKLRNCMNIDGVVRQLALFQPPIDPALLVRAAAAGIDLAEVLADSQAPLPLYRFNIMAQKANELCAEVKSLGASLLSAIEKGDAEALALMRSNHELQMMKQVRLVKEAQLLEAKTNMDAIGVSLQSAQTRFTHYIGLISQLGPLSIPTGPVVGPTLERLGAVALETISTATAFAQSVTTMIDPITAKSLDVIKQTMARAAEALSTSLPSQGMDTAQVPMNAAEKRQLDELKSAHDLQQKAADQRLVAQMLAMIPDFTLGAQGFASSPVVQFQLGGTLLSKVANFAASATDSKASEHTYRGTLHSMLAGYQRRASDWLLQAQLACWEIAQLSEQLKASTLRMAIATQELRNHDLQAANASEIEKFMHSKFSNQELYTWMSGQLANLHFQSYQLAYDVAKRAEQCFMHELGVDTTFIKFGYWDSLKKGLLAGEMLLSDIKRMEVAYLNQNAREFEITKHVSLRELDPFALVQLQENGECEFKIPEVLFDLDFPGHYFRRIKSVSISVPCIVGPYTSLSGTLTLLSSKLRVKSTVANNSYSDEDNFRASYLPAQSIATSTGQNDSGMFELNFRDERYLPFEGAGVISTWRLVLPATFRPFDYSTISDVVLHIRYTARDAGGSLKILAKNGLDDAVNAIVAAQGEQGFAHLFSLRQEFATEWHRLTSTGVQEFVITKNRFPFLLDRKPITISKVDLYVLPRSNATNLSDTFPTLTITSPDKNTPSITEGAAVGRLRKKTLTWTKAQVVNAIETDAKWQFTIPQADVVKIDDILMVCHYRAGQIT